MVFVISNFSTYGSGYFSLNTSGLAGTRISLCTCRVLGDMVWTAWFRIYSVSDCMTIPNSTLPLPELCAAGSILAMHPSIYPFW